MINLDLSNVTYLCTANESAIHWISENTPSYPNHRKTAEIVYFKIKNLELFNFKNHLRFKAHLEHILNHNSLVLRYKHENPHNVWK